MHLVIHAHTLKNEPLSQPITGRFDERGGTIGRSDTNTLALPDPERHISRLHAEVSFTGNGYAVRNVGSSNPISVNGRPVSPGDSAPLVEGDELMVGSYGMRVSLTTTTAIRETERQPVADGRTVIRASANESRTSPGHAGAAFSGLPPLGSNPDPFSDLLGVATSASPSGSGGSSNAADPFADLMGHGSPAAAPRPAAAPPVPQFAARPAPPMALGTPTVAPPAHRLPDDFNLFSDIAPPPRGAGAGMDAFMHGASPASAPSAPSAPGAENNTSPFGDLLGGGTHSGGVGSSLDDMFGLGKAPAHGADPLASFLSPSGASPGAPRPPAANQDPMAMFGASPAAGPAIPSDFNHTPELKGAYLPPAVQADFGTTPSYRRASAPPEIDPATTLAPAPIPAPAPRATPPAAQPPVAAPRAAPAPMQAPLQVPSPSTPGAANNPTSPEALWAAFCEGAGIKMQLPQGLNPDLMRVIGQVMHHSVEGTLKLMQVRAAAKQELRAQVTTIQSRNNNPLKFSPDAGIAIEQLLQPPMRGFMVGPTAVNDAMDDLLGHTIGTMAGMRAALAGVLQRFEPSQLEGKLVGGSMLDAVLPMNRRAKLWELYLQHFNRIQSDAEEDFHELFGKAFVRAYEDQLDRLDSARHPNV